MCLWNIAVSAHNISFQRERRKKKKQYTVKTWTRLSPYNHVFSDDVYTDAKGLSNNVSKLQSLIQNDFVLEYMLQ